LKCYLAKGVIIGGAAQGGVSFECLKGEEVPARGGAIEQVARNGGGITFQKTGGVQQYRLGICLGCKGGGLA